MQKTCSEYYCFIFSNIHQNNDAIVSGFPPTSGQIPPSSGSSNWPNWDPHMVYTVYLVTLDYYVPDLLVPNIDVSEVGEVHCLLGQHILNSIPSYFRLGETSKFPHTNHKRSSVRSHTLVPTSICDLSHNLCYLGHISSVTYVCHPLWFVCSHRKGILTSPLTTSLTYLSLTLTSVR